MSELRADTITASDGTSPVTLTKQSAAKAWVNFNGTGTPAARDSLNLSSITDTSAGRQSANWSSSFSNANYTCSGNASDSSGFQRTCQPAYANSISTSSIAFGTTNTTPALTDMDYVFASAHGDLA